MEEISSTMTKSLEEMSYYKVHEHADPGYQWCLKRRPKRPSNTCYMNKGNCLS